MAGQGEVAAACRAVGLDLVQWREDISFVWDGSMGSRGVRLTILHVGAIGDLPNGLHVDEVSRAFSSVLGRPAWCSEMTWNMQRAGSTEVYVDLEVHLDLTGACGTGGRGAPVSAPREVRGRA